jgi:hypothetical protein
MMQAVETYLAMRRAVGFELLNADYLLRSFAHFAAQRRENNVHVATAIDWASQTATVAQRDERLKTICRFVRYIRAEDNSHELPPADHFGYRKPSAYAAHLLEDRNPSPGWTLPYNWKPADLLRPHLRNLIGLLAQPVSESPKR